MSFAYAFDGSGTQPLSVAARGSLIFTWPAGWFDACLGMLRLLLSLGLLTVIAGCATSPTTVREESLAQSRCTLHGDSLYMASCYEFTGTTKPVYLPYLVKLHREFPNAIPINCVSIKSGDHQKAVQIPVCDMCESSIQARMSRFGE